MADHSEHETRTEDGPDSSKGEDDTPRIPPTLGYAPTRSFRDLLCRSLPADLLSEDRRRPLPIEDKA